MTRLVRSRRIESVAEAVGNTPLVRLRVVGSKAPSVEIYAKLDFEGLRSLAHPWPIGGGR